MALTKILKFEPEITDIIARMEWEQIDGQIIGKLTCGQLECKIYIAVNKALEAMGGKWNRKAEVHLFPTDPRPQVESLIDNRSVIIEKDGYFPTPVDIGRFMAEQADIKPEMTVLEPSAGTGELCEAILGIAPRCDIIAIEKDAKRVAVLESKGYRVIGRDFLEHNGQWKRIIQNPPFEDNQDIDHVYHAYGCLALGGRLVSVMSEGTFFRGGKAIKFREWLEEVGGWDFDLQPGAFAASGTDVKARIIVVNKIEETSIISQPDNDYYQLALFT